MVSQIKYLGEKQSRMILILESFPYVGYIQCNIHNSEIYSFNRKFAEKYVKVGGVVFIIQCSGGCIIQYREANDSSEPIHHREYHIEPPLDHSLVDPNVRICFKHHINILMDKLVNDTVSHTYNTKWHDYQMHDKHGSYQYDFHKTQEWCKCNYRYTLCEGEWKILPYKNIGKDIPCEQCQDPPVIVYPNGFLKMFREQYPDYTATIKEGTITVTKNV
jgi:hypothetical protein